MADYCNECALKRCDISHDCPNVEVDTFRLVQDGPVSRARIYECQLCGALIRGRLVYSHEIFHEHLAEVGL